MKISILVKIDENLDFGQNCRKILILVQFVENSRFWENLPKCRFWSKLKELLILVKILKRTDHGKKFSKISIFVKI